MRRSNLAASLCFALAFSPAAAAAQTWSGWAFGDAAPGTFGAEGGINYGGKVTVGLAAGIFHPWRFNRFTPEAEAYLGMTAEIGDFILWAYAGGGIYTDPEPTWTGRVSVWWLDTRPVGLFVSLYGMWTPPQHGMGASFLVQPRLGLELKAGRNLQVIPYLQAAVIWSEEGIEPAAENPLAPGVLALWSF